LATGAQIDNLPHGQQGHNGAAGDKIAGATNSRMNTEQHSSKQETGEDAAVAACPRNFGTFLEYFRLSAE
jgi:hypothetical protein